MDVYYFGLTSFVIKGDKKAESKNQDFCAL